MSARNFISATPVVTLVVGCVLGATVSWLLLATSLETVWSYIDGSITIVLLIIVAFVALMAIALPFGYLIALKIAESAKGTLESVSAQLVDTADALSSHDRQRTLDNVHALVREFSAWYAPAALRRFVVQTVLGLLIAFGGFTGTALLFRQTVLTEQQTLKIVEQTKLLAEQNVKLDIQTISGDAQKRATLAAELFAITTALANAPDAPIDRGMTARIVAFSRSATPYALVTVASRKNEDGTGQTYYPVVGGRPLSPERGQLVTTLLLLREKISNIRGIMLQYADLRGATFDIDQPKPATAGKIKSLRLCGEAGRIDMTHLDLSGSSFDNADLSGLETYNSRIANADFIGTDLTNANFCNSILSGSRFNGASLNGANLREAWLVRADFGSPSPERRSVPETPPSVVVNGAG